MCTWLIIIGSLRWGGGGVNMNRRESLSDIKKEIVRIKMGWKHYQTVDPRKRELQVARGLFGIRLLILHFKFPNPSNLQHFIFSSI